MGKKIKTLVLLFKECFLLSTFTFGGGYVIIALMKKRFVDELHFLKEEEILDITTIAQSAPGAVAVNAALLVGYKIAGAGGAFVALIATVLPPMLILTLISYIYDWFITNTLVANILKTMTAVVAAIIIDIVLAMLVNIFKIKQKAEYLSLVLAVIAVFILKLDILYLIAFGILLGIVYTLILRKRGLK